jgi:hypothetical protein
MSEDTFAALQAAWALNRELLALLEKIAAMGFTARYVEGNCQYCSADAWDEEHVEHESGCVYLEMIAMLAKIKGDVS